MCKEQSAKPLRDRDFERATNSPNTQALLSNELPPFAQIMNDLEERRKVLISQLQATEAGISLLRDNPDMSMALETLRLAHVYTRVVPFGY